MDNKNNKMAQPKASGRPGYTFSNNKDLHEDMRGLTRVGEQQKVELDFPNSCKPSTFDHSFRTLEL